MKQVLLIVCCAIAAGADITRRDRHGNTPCDLLSNHLSDPDVRERICKAASTDDPN